jgi:catechol 2,3-dioxygenase
LEKRLFENDRPKDCLRATLHHIALASPDPAGLADFYHRALGYNFKQSGDLRLGGAPNRYILITPGKAKTLDGASFALPDAAELDRLRARIDQAGWPRVDSPRPFFRDAVSVRDPDGTEFIFGLVGDTVFAPEGVGHWAARIQHVVMASLAPERVVSFFLNVLGFTLSDNVVDGEGGVRTSFMRCSQEHHSFAVFKASEYRLDHHCYEVTDWNLIRDWGDHMANQRIPLKWGPGRHGPGNNLFLFVHDPDGNWVELSAELEIVSHDRPVGTWPHEEHTLNLWGQGLLRS